MASTSTTVATAVCWDIMTVPADMLPVFHRVRALAATSTVVVLTLRGCSMAVAVETILHGLGVAVKSVEIEAGGEINQFLDRIAGKSGDDGREVAVPAVFVGGRYIGGLNRVIACHISGHLVPILKEAGALWL